MRYYIKKLIPKPLFRAIAPVYHYILAFVGALYCRFPARGIIVIGVTGTKGKTTTVELIASLLEAQGFTVASGGTYQFRVAGTSERNMYKMTMPGRFALQRFLRRAVDEGCTHAVVEMTSQGVLQFRHKWIDMDALVFTNISPEHLESHGSFEGYLAAKLALAHELENSHKKEQRIIANVDDPYGKRFLAVRVPQKYPFSLGDVEPYSVTPEGITLTFEERSIFSPLLGEFNAYNLLAAIVTARAFGVSLKTIKETLADFSGVRGRLEEIRVSDDQPFRVYVDYAHTPDSLEKVYTTFKDNRKICVLGNTGGGRDTWKRPVMAGVAETHCDHIIFTNEDPYDEDPQKIIDGMTEGISDKDKYTIIMDRRKAIREALKIASQLAEDNDKNDIVVLITGKGTDPYIMVEGGKKIPWDDADVTREELERVLGGQKKLEE